MFDEEPDAPLHGECAAEIARLNAMVTALERGAAKAERRAIMFGDIVATHTIAMQAAVIDAALVGPKWGMRWIRNTLSGPGYLPDPEIAVGMGGIQGGAQAWFDSKIAEHEAFRAAHPGPCEPDEPTALAQAIDRATSINTGD